MSVNHVKSKLTNVVNQWDILIADAERQLTEAKTRAAGLEKAVQNFKRLRDSGAAWPKSVNLVRETVQKA